MRSFTWLFTALCWALMLAGAALAAEAPPADSAADPQAAPAIRLLPDDWYPESLATAPDGTLYVGSWRQGAVARLRPNGPAPEIFVPPGSNGLSNAQGLLVDAKAGLLWVCSGDMGFTTVPKTPSALKSYELASGAPRASYAMPDAGYCNDLAQAGDGTLYVSDSLHPRILRLAAGGSALAVWSEDPQLGAGDARLSLGGTTYFLNGIALDPRRPDGPVYVSAVNAVPYVLRVDRRPDGSAGIVRRIAAPRVLKNVDALRWLDDTHLVLFESNAFGTDKLYGGAVTLATLDGDRITELQPLVGGLNDASSGLVQGGRVWYIESKYGLLTAHPDDDAAVPRHVPFSVQAVVLPPLR